MNDVIIQIQISINIAVDLMRIAAEMQKSHRELGGEIITREVKKMDKPPCSNQLVLEFP